MRQGFQSLSDWGLTDRPRSTNRVDRAYPQARRGLKSPSRERKSVKTDCGCQIKRARTSVLFRGLQL
ncbi:hypothetical protein [Microcoleus sp. D3_18_C2]|uniref:hypothetical protein n=1 Tax=Microcoleus sp. D3_18_C2 TaxID=3055334 RepID=UPI002FD6300A